MDNQTRGKKTKTGGRSKASAQKEAAKRKEYNVVLVDSGTGEPLPDYVVKWYAGRKLVSTTRTDALGNVKLTRSAAMGEVRDLEAQIFKPHPDTRLPPVLAAKVEVNLSERSSGIHTVKIQPPAHAGMRVAGEPKDRARKIEKITNALALKGDALKKRFEGIGVDEGMAGYRAGQAAIMNLGINISQYALKDVPPELLNIYNQLFGRQKCACKDCESALSPLAYLALLVDFATRHIDKVSPANASVTIADLETHFGQKFSKLTQSCHASEGEIAQALIAIEVLENHFVLNPLTAADSTKLGQERAKRLFDAYLVLLQRTGISFDDLRLADTADKKTQLAAIVGIDASKVDSLKLDATLSPPNPNALTAARLAQLFGFASGQGTTAPDTPDILSWRYQALSKSWEDSDQPATDGLNGAPVIDPDVIGPDDFRNPVLKPNAAAPDGPFDVWNRRRGWIDSALATLDGLTDADSMLARMYQPFAYQAQNVTPWAAATPVTAFASIASDLAQGVQVDTDAARLDSDLELSTDAFVRLMTLRTKDELARATPPRGASLSDQERAELLAILGGSIKRCAFTSWTAEEQAAAIGVDPKYFWAPRQNPAAGAWPPILPAGTPYLDPTALSAGDLPEGQYGNAARTLLSARAAQLLTRRNTLAQTRENQGYAQCVAAGLSWWTVPAGSTTIAELRLLSQSLSPPATAAAAQARIQNELFMSTDDFGQIMQVDQREQANELLAASDYEAAYQALTNAYRKQQYATWVTQEATYSYWQLLKLKLVPWLAATDDRVRWQLALETARRPVVVDPDLTYASDFILSQRAYTLWLARGTEVSTHLVSLRNQTAAARATPPTAVESTTLDTLLTSEIGVSAQDLQDLQASADTGDDTDWRLNQLMLDWDLFAELNRIIRLASTTAGTKRLLDTEWENVFSICTQVWKLRDRSRAWHAEEATRTATVRPVTLSPDYFQILPPPDTVYPPPSPPPLPQWRASNVVRNDWLDTLQSRIDLKTSTGNAWHTAIRGAEEIALPPIRDALVQAAGIPGMPLVRTADDLENQYLIDFRMGGCATTTRVAQAIETIQEFVEGLRTSSSILTQDYIIDTTTIDYDAFDEDWVWLGSYSSFRSAMFVLLFPEVLASPSLREHQTYGFGQLIQSLRGTSQLTPDLACQFASDYADYFNDVVNLELSACTRANLRNADSSCATRALSPLREVEFLLALAPSQTMYYAARDTGASATLSYMQSSWLPVDKLSGIQKIFAATVYEPVSAANSAKRSVVVILKTAEGQSLKLKIITFDLDTAEWSEPSDLQLPSGFVDFDAAFVANSANPSTADRPTIEILPLPSGDGQYRSLTDSLTGWDGSTFNQRLIGVEIHDLRDDEISWLADTQWPRSAGDIDAANTWAAANGFLTGLPTFRTVGGNHEIIAFDRFSIDDLAFTPNDSRVPWGPLLGFGAVGGSYDRQLASDDSLAVSWLKVATTAVRAAGSNYLAGIPTFDFNLSPSETPSSTLVIHAIKQSAFVTKTSVALQSLDNTLFTNLQSHQSALAGFYEAVQAYAVAQGYAAGIPTWWAVVNNSSTIDKNVVDDANIPGTYTFEVLLLKSGDGLTKLSSACNVSDWKPAYPGGNPTFAYYHKPTAKDLNAWRRLVYNIYAANNAATPDNLNYLDEASYFVPMIIAQNLERAGEYDAALEWFQLVLDWNLGVDQGIQQSRFLYRHSQITPSWDVTDDWLRDPLQPHRIAATRPNAYSRYTLFAIINCRLDYGDALYTAEENAKAKFQYRKALELLDASVLQVVDPCAPKQNSPQLDPNIVGSIQGTYRPVIDHILNELSPLEQKLREKLTGELKKLVNSASGLGGGLPAFSKKVEQELAKLPPPPTLGDILDANAKIAKDLTLAVQGNASLQPRIETAIRTALIRRDANLPVAAAPDNSPKPMMRRFAANIEKQGSLSFIGQEAAALSDVYGVGAGYGILSGALNPFCIPINPLLRALRLYAEVNINKIENCRNIAGMKATVDFYGAPTDTSTGMPSIGAGGQITIPGALQLAPTQYRYSFLIGRAKELAQLAQQMENQMFSALTQRDAAGYTLLKAQQDVETSQADLVLQDLKLRQTQDEQTLTTIQQQRANFEVQHFTSLLNAGLNAWEVASLAMTTIAATHAAAAAVGYFSTYRYVEGVSAGGQAWQISASIASAMAQYERRNQDWQYQRALAQYDVSVANQQATISQDSVQISTQERAVSQLKYQLTQDSVGYLTTKQFATVELFDWMAKTLEGVYRTMLQNATSVARLAASQLAFERQQQPPALIKSDYWQVQDDAAVSDLGAATPDRKGLTGATRLLSDVELLEQYAIDTDQRKLHLTRTISLAQLAPLEFELFRKTGVLAFATPMSLFDQDFPGHYLRLIKRVRVSLIALIPPNSGIKATLTASATSRVVVGGDTFQTIRLQHGPDLVALTSTQNATGVFDFDVNTDMQPPFAGGVDTTWEFRLPRAANQFDYDTIADILLTLDYTAMWSSDYEKTVISNMRPSFEAERGYSFKNDFEDTWYDLLNPGSSATPMTVRWQTTRDDFPINLDRIKIEQVALAFTLKDGMQFEIPIAGLQFTPDGDPTSYGGAATTLDAIASTRRGNAQSWSSIIGRQPFGTWELALPNSAVMRNRFSSGAIENVVIVVSYAGLRPAWPNS